MMLVSMTWCTAVKKVNQMLGESLEYAMRLNRAIKAW